MNISKINNVICKQDIHCFNNLAVKTSSDIQKQYEKSVIFDEIKHYYTNNNSEIKLKKAFIETKDIENNKIFVEKIYPKISDFLGVKNIAPTKIKFINKNENWSALYKETTGEIIVNTHMLNKMNKKEITKTLAHELTHLGQYTKMYKHLGKNNFKETMTNSIFILKSYANENNLNANNYNDVDKIIDLINKDIENSEVYNKAEKLILSQKDIQKSKLYQTALDNYVDPEKNYNKYRNNLIEKEAFAQGDLMKQKYENFSIN